MKINKLATVLAVSFLAFVSCKNENKDTNEPVEAVEQTDSNEVAANLETATFAVDGMMCPSGCANVIERKLGNLDGVSKAKVDYDSKTATITYDATMQNSESVKTMVEGLADGKSYKVSDFKSETNKKS